MLSLVETSTRHDLHSTTSWTNGAPEVRTKHGPHHLRYVVDFTMLSVIDGSTSCQQNSQINKLFYQQRINYCFFVVVLFLRIAMTRFRCSGTYHFPKVVDVSIIFIYESELQQSMRDIIKTWITVISVFYVNNGVQLQMFLRWQKAAVHPDMT